MLALGPSGQGNLSLLASHEQKLVPVRFAHGLGFDANSVVHHSGGEGGGKSGTSFTVGWSQGLRG